MNIIISYDDKTNKVQKKQSAPRVDPTVIHKPTDKTIKKHLKHFSCFGVRHMNSQSVSNASGYLFSSLKDETSALTVLLGRSSRIMLGQRGGVSCSPRVRVTSSLLRRPTNTWSFSPARHQVSLRVGR